MYRPTHHCFKCSNLSIERHLFQMIVHIFHLTHIWNVIKQWIWVNDIDAWIQNDEWCGFDCRNELPGKRSAVWRELKGDRVSVSIIGHLKCIFQPEKLVKENNERMHNWKEPSKRRLLSIEQNRYLSFQRVFLSTIFAKILIRDVKNKFLPDNISFVLGCVHKKIFF